jgi:hypothetical protein
MSGQPYNFRKLPLGSGFQQQQTLARHGCPGHAVYCYAAISLPMLAGEKNSARLVVCANSPMKALVASWLFWIAPNS